MEKEREINYDLLCESFLEFLKDADLFTNETCSVNEYNLYKGIFVPELYFRDVIMSFISNDFDMPESVMRSTLKSIGVNSNKDNAYDYVSDFFDGLRSFSDMKTLKFLSMTYMEYIKSKFGEPEEIKIGFNVSDDADFNRIPAYRNVSPNLDFFYSCSSERSYIHPSVIINLLYYINEWYDSDDIVMGVDIMGLTFGRACSMTNIFEKYAIPLMDNKFVIEMIRKMGITTYPIVIPGFVKNDESVSFVPCVFSNVGHLKDGRSASGLMMQQTVCKSSTLAYELSFRMCLGSTDIDRNFRDRVRKSHPDIEMSDSSDEMINDFFGKKNDLN